MGKVHRDWPCCVGQSRNITWYTVGSCQIIKRQKHNRDITNKHQVAQEGHELNEINTSQNLSSQKNAVPGKNRLSVASKSGVADHSDNAGQAGMDDIEYCSDQNISDIAGDLQSHEDTEQEMVGTHNDAILTVGDVSSGCQHEEDINREPCKCQMSSSQEVPKQLVVHVPDQQATIAHKLVMQNDGTKALIQEATKCIQGINNAHLIDDLMRSVQKGMNDDRDYVCVIL